MFTPFVYNYSYGYQTSTFPHPQIGASGHGGTHIGTYHSIGSVPSGKEPMDRKRPRQEWICENCELTLDTETALRSHRQSHVKCTACSFEAAPKVVKGHYQAVHGKFSGSGFKTVTVAIPGCRVQRFRICVGNRPEDIQKWIAERKKRFPRRQQQIQQKGQQEQNHGGKRQPSDDGGHAELLSDKQAKEDRGLSSLLAGYGSSSDDDIEKPLDEKKIPTSTQKPVEESNSKPNDDENPEPDELCKKNHDVRAQRSGKPCRYFMRNGTCLNGSACRFSHEVTQGRHSNGPSPRPRRDKRLASSDTLLRRLLANDMRRESTMTLQLLRYIADCNYFQRPSPVIERAEELATTGD